MTVDYHAWTHRPKELGGTDPLDILDPPYHIKVVADDEDVETGDGKFIFHIPKWYDGFYLVDIESFINTAAGDVIVSVTKNGTDMLSTSLKIDSGDEASADSATPVVINQSVNQVAHKDKISINVDTASGQGLEVVPLFEPWQIR